MASTDVLQQTQIWEAPGEKEAMNANTRKSLRRLQKQPTVFVSLRLKTLNLLNY